MSKINQYTSPLDPKNFTGPGFTNSRGETVQEVGERLINSDDSDVLNDYGSKETLTEYNDKTSDIEDSANDSSVDHSTSTGGSEKYIVEEGNNLSTIAKEHNQSLGEGGQFMSVEALAILNGINNPNLIHPGQELVLTADKSVVDSCNEDIKSFASALDGLNERLQAVSLDGCLDDDGGEIDSNFIEIKRNFSTNVETIVADANSYSKWLTDLSTALDDTELYATNVIDSETFSNPNSF